MANMYFLYIQISNVTLYISLYIWLHNIVWYCMYIYIYVCVMAFLDIRLLDSYLVSLKYPPWLQGDSCSIASIDEKGHMGTSDITAWGHYNSSLVGGLVVDLPVWKIWKSVWIIISKIWKKIMFQKPPTRSRMNGTYGKLWTSMI